MLWQEWSKLFRRTTDDPILRDVLAREGYPEVPAIGRNETDVVVEEGGLMLEFLDAQLYPSLAGGLGQGHGILSAMTFTVKDGTRDPWPGDLPFGLVPQDSQEALRKRFGQPKSHNTRRLWDLWMIDGYEVTVYYQPDFGSLSGITVAALDRNGEEAG